MAGDPYRYYRVEAHELLEQLGEGVLELERGGAGAETTKRMLRLAHTLKGASRIVKQPAIAELAHQIEGLLAVEGAASPARTRELLGLLDAIGAKLGELDAPAAKAQPEAPPQPETIRIEADEVERLTRGVQAASVRLAALGRGASAIDRARALLGELAGKLDQAGNGARAIVERARGELDRHRDELTAGVDQIESELAQVRDATDQLRLVPAATLFAPLERAARDAAEAVGKRVELVASGGETRLDARMVPLLRDALLQLVRNAVAHGIETPERRAQAGKPPAGRVEVAVSRRGAQVAIACRDDGAGIDLQAVRRVAVERRWVEPAAAARVGPDEVLPLLLRSGFTTSRAADAVSGRGIGLDLVREAAARLRGTLAARSEPQQGATFEIAVPLSLTSLAVLEVEAAGTVASLPVSSVRRARRVLPEELLHAPDRDELIHDGRAIPFLPLARVLGARKASPRGRACSAVVVESPGGVAALGVDRLLGTREIVLRPLPPIAEASPIYAGASLDLDGNPQLVLDPAGLIAQALADPGADAADAAAPAQRILVIDDSLTTRMLEQSILESAGYQVGLATSAEQGLIDARASRFDLFLVDVEMPGMDGFSFVELTRADPALRVTPAILVTSRSAPADRRRADEVGARGYVVKGEFDQNRLLGMIRELIG